MSQQQVRLWLARGRNLRLTTIQDLQMNMMLNTRMNQPVRRSSWNHPTSAALSSSILLASRLYWSDKWQSHFCYPEVNKIRPIFEMEVHQPFVPPLSSSSLEYSSYRSKLLLKTLQLPICALGSGNPTFHTQQFSTTMTTVVDHSLVSSITPVDASCSRPSHLMTALVDASVSPPSHLSTVPSSFLAPLPPCCIPSYH